MAGWHRGLEFEEGQTFVSRADVAEYVNQGDRHERAESIRELADALGVSVRSAQRYVTEGGAQQRGVRGFIGSYAEAVADALGIETKLYREITEIRFYGEVTVYSKDKKGRYDTRYRGSRGNPVRVSFDEESSEEIQRLYFEEGLDAAEQFLLETYGIEYESGFTSEKWGKAHFRVIYEGGR